MIDLHTHSNCSDGSMTPYDLVRYAKQKGLSAIALTDHDNTEGIDEALKAGEEFGINVICGVEFSTEEICQVHILGYFFDYKNKELQDAFKRQQKERVENFQKYLKKFEENGLPMTEEEVLEKAPSGNVGRAHYAKVMMEKGYVDSVKEAFDRYLGIGMPLYIRREVMEPKEAIALIHNAGGLAFFAHPHQTKLEDEQLYSLILRLKEAGLDGIEGYYPEYTPEMGEKFRLWAKSLNLLLSGGSDYHAAMKPHIEIGEGIEGNLCIPDDLIDKMKERLAQK